jgi:hypothetical protein
VPPPPPGPAPTGEALAGFLSDCEENVNGWHRGEAVYPGTLTVELDQAVAYRAGVAISGAADLQAQLPGSTAVPVDVRCGLGARLTSPDGTIEVDEADWMLQEFDQPGMVRWAWNVTGTEPGDHELLLELRPAVAVEGALVVPGGSTGPMTTTAFVTAVHVDATMIERMSVWWDDNWDTITTIAAGLGAAIAGLIVWLRNMSGELRGKGRSARIAEKTDQQAAGSGAGDGTSPPPDPPARP